MSRRMAREVALMTLFGIDVNPPDFADEEANALKPLLDMALGEFPAISKRGRSYARKLVKGTRKNIVAIDEMISAASSDWRLGRMATVDRNILRLAAFEMRFLDEGLTPAIVINEAVEIAKMYGADESGRFVNGILGALAKFPRQGT